MFFLFTLNIRIFNLIKLSAFRWLNYNFQNSKSKNLASSFRREKSSITCSVFYCIPPLNFLLGKQDIFIEINSRSDCLTSSLILSWVLIVPFIDTTIVKYSNYNFQRIIRNILEAKLFSAPIVVALNALHNKLLKVRPQIFTQVRTT